MHANKHTHTCVLEYLGAHFCCAKMEKKTDEYLGVCSNSNIARFVTKRTTNIYLKNLATLLAFFLC